MDRLRLSLLRLQEWFGNLSSLGKFGLGALLAILLGIAQHLGLIPNRHPHHPFQ